MKNYYEIMGLPDFSGIEAIKKQFRKLALIYHPDKNPDGAEKFKEIVEAYEILSDSIKKQKYDAQLRYSLNSIEKKLYSTTTRSPFKEKNPVDIKEATRRKYYEQHYKKKSFIREAKNEPSVMKGSNEFRNILIAIPLTVILFLWLIDFFEKRQWPIQEPKEDKISKERISNHDFIRDSEKYYGKKMYLDFFKNYTKTTQDTLSLEISNQLDHDIIVLLFEQKKQQLINSVYLPSFHSVLIEDIPDLHGLIKIQMGEDYNNLLHKINEKKILGGFEKKQKFFQVKKKYTEIPKKWIINKDELSKMEEISMNEFFKAQ